MEVLTWLGISIVGVTATLSALSIAFILSLVIGQAGYQLYNKIVN
jgi:hypothetical protein